MPCLDTPSGVLRKKRPSEPRYKDPAPFAVLVGSGVRVERGEEIASAVPPASSTHLRDSCPTTVVSVLEHHSKRAS